MVLYLGETVRVVATALDPETSLPIDPVPTEAVAGLFAPSTGDPRLDPSLRSTPDETATLTYDTETQRFVANVNSAGFAKQESGTWFLMITVTGALYSNFEFGRFKLKP